MTNINSLQDFLKTHYESPSISLITESIPAESLSDGKIMFINGGNYSGILRGKEAYNLIISSVFLNDFEDINESLIKIYDALRNGGIFICRVETLSHRNLRLSRSYNKISYKFAIFYDFIFKRVLPKSPGIRKIYENFNIIKHHILSKCEALGRVRYCGFEISELKEIGNYLYFIAFKDSKLLDKKPSDGFLLRIPKVGKEGRTILCYKLRTMYTYANYLHDYILKNHRIDDEGKVIGDFRKTGWGNILRKTWLDEMPQLYNVLKGDIYFIGLRPVSKEFLSLYPKEWRLIREKLKPGFVPPYYADCPKSFEEIMESEKTYYEAWLKYPHRTNFIYFWKVVFNFLSGRTRTG